MRDMTKFFIIWVSVIFVITLVAIYMHWEIIKFWGIGLIIITLVICIISSIIGEKKK